MNNGDNGSFRTFKEVLNISRECTDKEQSLSEGIKLLYTKKKMKNRINELTQKGDIYDSLHWTTANDSLHYIREVYDYTGNQSVAAITGIPTQVEEFNISLEEEGSSAQEPDILGSITFLRTNHQMLTQGESGTIDEHIEQPQQQQQCDELSDMYRYTDSIHKDDENGSTDGIQEEHGFPRGTSIPTPTTFEDLEDENMYGQVQIHKNMLDETTSHDVFFPLLDVLQSVETPFDDRVGMVDSSKSDQQESTSDLGTMESVPRPDNVNCRRGDIMDRPLPFIETRAGGQIVVNPDVINILDKISTPVSVIAIAGKYRTGKSYLMNRLFDSNAGFSLGPTGQATTKGTWIRIRTHPADPNRTLVLLDTEGLDDFENGDETHDMKLLALLLSSCLVYNAAGTPEDIIIQHLDLVCEHIRTEDNPEEDGNHFNKYFPSFFFILRDVFLRSEIDGKPWSPDQYLENVLKHRKGQGKKTNKYNIRRKCLVLCKPVDDDDKLACLEKVHDSEIKTKFLEDVLTEARPFQQDDNIITGSRFFQLVQTYLEAIHNGVVPCISNAIQLLKENGCQRAVEESVLVFNNLEELMPVTQQQMTQFQKNAHNEALEHYRKNAWFDKDRTYVQKLADSLEEAFDMHIKNNDQASAQKYKKIMQEFFDRVDVIVKTGIMESNRIKICRVKEFRNEIQLLEIINNSCGQKSCDSYPDRTRVISHNSWDITEVPIYDLGGLECYVNLLDKSIQNLCNLSFVHNLGETSLLDFAPDNLDDDFQQLVSFGFLHHFISFLIQKTSWSNAVYQQVISCQLRLTEKMLRCLMLVKDLIKTTHVPGSSNDLNIFGFEALFLFQKYFFQSKQSIAREQHKLNIMNKKTKLAPIFGQKYLGQNEARTDYVFEHVRLGEQPENVTDTIIGKKQTLNVNHRCDESFWDSKVWRVSGHTKTFKRDNSGYTTTIGGQHYITLPEDVATKSICAKQDTHRITEMQLLMSGVEPNPGPGPNNGMVSLNAGVVHSEFQANKSQSASNHPDKVKYESQLMRLASFGNKAQQFPLYSTTRLAQHGLYATERMGQLKCFSCDFVYNPTDHMDPIIMHNQVKNCGYLNSYRYPKEPVYQSDSGTEVETPNVAQHTAQTLLSPAFQADANSAMRQVEHYHHDGRSNTGNSINSLGSNFSSQGNTGRTGMDTNPRNGPQGHHANAVRRRIGCVDHRLEICRLETFRQWPSNAAVRPEDLANSGFYYLGTDDRVQCAFCRGILRNWEPEDKPLAEHLRHFPQCPFLEDPTSAGNIQLGEEDDSIFSNVELRETTGPVQHTYPNAGSVGIMTDRPNNQKYAMPQERLASFRDYPSNAVQSAEELTRAGFYYTNHTDTVKCFFCDVTVRNWRPNDDPWFVHARWSPRCGYVRMCKGDDFISDVQTKKNMSSRNVENYPRPNRRVKPAKKFKVTSEQLANALDSVVVKAVLDMSFSEETVKKVIKRRLQELGDDFPNPESLVDECTEFVDYSSDSESDMETEDDNTAEASKAPAQACAGEASTSTNTNVQPPQLFASNLEEYTIEDEQKLLEETQRLKEDRQCKVCLDDPANIVFLKCGHLVCCQSCAPAMRHCPVCRNPILGTIKVDINN